MGIHYDYKSTRGDKKMRKQQRVEAEPKPELTIPEDVVLTMDMLTDPNFKK